MRCLALILPAALAVSACAGVGLDRDRGTDASAPAPAPVTPGRIASSNPSAALVAPPAAATAAAGVQPAGAAGGLGTTTVTLGDPTLGGLWLKTPLVQSARNGRIVDTATGRSTDVQLLPLAWSATGGSQISHGAMHELGRDLTDLPELQVFGG